MALNGKFGTSPKALRDFLKSNGFTAAFTAKEADFAAFAAKYPGLIFTMYNDRNDIRKEIHTIHIGKVVGPFTSFDELIQNINGGKAKGISLIGIKT